MSTEPSFLSAISRPEKLPKKPSQKLLGQAPEKKPVKNWWFNWRLDWALIGWLVLAAVGLAAVGGGVYLLTTSTNTVCQCSAEGEPDGGELTGSVADGDELAGGEPDGGEPTGSVADLGAGSAQVARTRFGLEPGQVLLAADISGAVAQPGIYELPVEARVADLIQVAGGLLPQADPGFVSQELNLSVRLEDEFKLYIPTQTEREYEQSATEFCQQLTNASPEKSMAGVAGEKDGQLISINTASRQELESLPGIGEKRAGDIMAGRPYTSLSELTERQILTETVLSKIQDQVGL